jgi:hypothetical protein
MAPEDLLDPVAAGQLPLLELGTPGRLSGREAPEGLQSFELLFQLLMLSPETRQLGLAGQKLTNLRQVTLFH